MVSTNRRPRRGAARSRASALRRKAIAHAESLTTADDWQDLLKYASHFHELGGVNALLILRERPQATRLATYEQWHREGRQVRRGERGMTLFAPAMPGETTRVFDVTQTGHAPATGPLSYVRPAGYSPSALLTALKSVAMRQGFDVVHDSPDTAGRTAFGEHSIRLHPRLGTEGACHALAHELAHILLHHASGLTGATGACDGTRLVEAESVAYLICRHAGIDVAPFTFPDPPTWAGTDPRANRGRAILHVAERVGSTAHALITRLDVIDHGRRPYTEPTPTKAEPARPTAPPRDPRLTEIHQRAERFFIEHLPSSWVPGYLAGRGLAAALGRAVPWHIGYAPASWTALVDHLRAHGHTDDEIIASGLGTRSRTGGLIDRFRDRAMLPVHAPDGVPIAFIGRANPDVRASERHPVPKYLNSPQTALYTKGATLFGLEAARPRLDAGAIPVLVEGTLDAIAIHIADPERRYAPVAPSGTALTREQVTALGQAVDLRERGIIVAFDGDPAGTRAAARAHKLLHPHTDRLHHARLAAGDDPAGLLEHHGPERLSAALANREPLAAVVLEEHLNTTRDQPPWQRRDAAARFITELTPTDAVRHLAVANVPAPGQPPENPVFLSATAAADMLPATTNHLILHAAEDIGTSVTELIGAVVDTASESHVPAATQPVADDGAYDAPHVPPDEPSCPPDLAAGRFEPVPEPGVAPERRHPASRR